MCCNILLNSAHCVRNRGIDEMDGDETKIACEEEGIITDDSSLSEMKAALKRKFCPSMLATDNSAPARHLKGWPPPPPPPPPSPKSAGSVMIDGTAAGSTRARLLDQVCGKNWKLSKVTQV